MKYARVLLALVALVHLLVPAVMLARRAALTAEIARRNPSFDPAELHRAVTAALAAAAVFHAVLLVLAAVLALRLSAGRRWTVRLTIVSQLLGVAFSVVSWQSSAMFHPLVIAADLVQLAVVALVLRELRLDPARPRQDLVHHG